MVNVEHWEYKRAGDWLVLVSPSLQRGNLSFGEKRGVVEGLKEIEKIIKADPSLVGWICDTKVTYFNIHVLFAKVKGVPFQIKDGVIWYNKRIGE